MVLAPWLRRLPAKLGLGKHATRGHLAHDIYLDEQAFHYETAREKMRVDRNGSPLAILVIELPATRRTSRDLAFLGRVLEGRLRITDTVGLLSDQRVGILLPDTSEPNAWKIASDICDVYEVGKDRPDCEVFVYPEAKREKANDTHRREKEPVAVEPIETLFTYRIPAWKRAVDILGASFGLLLSAPVLVFAGGAIKLNSHGPMLFSQEREGQGGRRFRIYKLRTMRHDAESRKSSLREQSHQDGPAFKMWNDPRITRVGRWLRITSLDELPQLWNVLVGEMSLVGPRPLPMDESLQCASWQRQRLSVPPGITCIWQIQGRNMVSFEQWMRMDLQYLRKRSFAYDMGLLLQTVPALLFHRGPR